MITFAVCFVKWSMRRKMKLADRLTQYMWFVHIILMSGVIVVVIAIPEALYPKTLFSNYNHYHVLLIISALVIIWKGVTSIRKYNEVGECKFD
jgi:hypothetical protein